MVIRGAPAIGVAAAMGVAIGVEHSPAPDRWKNCAPNSRRFATRWRARGRRPWIFSGPSSDSGRRFEELGRRVRAATMAARAWRHIRAGAGGGSARACTRSGAKPIERIGRFGAELLPRSGPRDDAMQCRGAGDGGHRHGAGRDSHGCRGGAARSTCWCRKRGRTCRARD